MLDVQFPTANSLRLQCRVCCIAFVARVEAFIAIGCAERPTVGRLEVRVRLGGKDQTCSWTQSVFRFFMPVAAKAQHEGQVFANGVLVLKIECPVPGRTLIVKVEVIRLDIVVLLLLLNILAEFGAERDPMSFEKDSGSIALEVPPASVGFVVVFGVRMEYTAP